MDHQLIRRTIALFGSALVLAVTMVFPLIVGAASPPPAGPSPAPSPSGGGTGGATTWGVQPSSATGPTGRPAFEYELAPGSVVEDYVGVSNFGDAPLTVHLYATDAFNTDDGGFALLTVDQAPTDVGSWVELAEDTYEIPPRKRLDIPFRVVVPGSAEPGDHIGGLVASVEVPARDANGNAVILDRRVGSRIYLRVAGPIEPSMALEGLTAAYDGGWNPVAGTLTVTYTVRNTGNVRLAAHQHVAVTGPFGWALRDVALDDLPELLPGSSVTATTTVTSIPPVGITTAAVHVEPFTAIPGVSGAIEPIGGRVDAWAPPILLAGVILLAIEAIWGLLWLQRRRSAQIRADLARAIEAARAEGLALGRRQAAPSASDDPGAPPDA